MEKKLITCDIKGCGAENPANVKKQIQVIFHTEQTEGRGVTPYLSNETIDICSSCLTKVLKGNYIHGSGAMGYNDYWF